jgi:hypothetical protein
VVNLLSWSNVLPGGRHFGRFQVSGPARLFETYRSSTDSMIMNIDGNVQFLAQIDRNTGANKDE